MKSQAASTLAWGLKPAVTTYLIPIFSLLLGELTFAPTSRIPSYQCRLCTLVSEGGGWGKGTAGTAGTAGKSQLEGSPGLPGYLTCLSWEDYIGPVP